MTCVGYEGRTCTNPKYRNHPTCKSCHGKRLRRYNRGMCTAKGGTCPFTHEPEKRWCHLCYLLDEHKKTDEKYKHDCSSRGGGACSTCDDWYCEMGESQDTIEAELKFLFKELSDNLEACRYLAKVEYTKV